MAGFINFFIALTTLALSFAADIQPTHPFPANLYQPGWEIRTISADNPDAEITISNPSISSTGRFISYLSSSSPDSGKPTEEIVIYDSLVRSIVDQIGFDSEFQIDKAVLSSNSRFIVIEAHSRKVPSIQRVQIYDRLMDSTDDTYDQFSTNQISNAISHDGRYLILRKLNPDGLHLLDRYTSQDFPLFLPANDQFLTSAAISSDGRWIAYGYGSGISDGIFESRIQLFDRVFQTTQTVYSSTDETIENLSLNNNGILLSFRSRIGDDISTGKYIDLSSDEFVSGNLPGSADFTSVLPAQNQVISIELKQSISLTSLHDLNNNRIEIIPINPMDTHVSTSDSGNQIVFVGSNGNSSSVYLASRSSIPSGTSYSGQVTGEHGYPIGSVNVSIGDRETKTDHQGLYFFEHVTSSQEPQFNKDGYTFEINSVAENHATVLGFPDGLIEEARLDIGMPYSFDRGCSSPFDPCGGPYHGFFTGFCTDLIYDAYLWGANYNIQTALVKDAISNPEHFYRWRDARNAHDMWRYFAYTDQMIWENTDYAVGDIVFFDWEDNSEIDHVAIVSEVRSSGKPKSLIDATGKINFNPSGLTAELPWLAFHDSTVRGHARWNGLFTANPITQPEFLVLQNSILMPGGDVSFYSIIQSDERTGNQPLTDIRNLNWEVISSIPLDTMNTRLYVNIIPAEKQEPEALITSQIYTNRNILNRDEKEFILDSNQLIRFAITVNTSGENPQLEILQIIKTSTGEVNLIED